MLADRDQILGDDLWRQRGPGGGGGVVEQNQLHRHLGMKMEPTGALQTPALIHEIKLNYM